MIGPSKMDFLLAILKVVSWLFTHTQVTMIATFDLFLGFTTLNNVQIHCTVGSQTS